jgi:hypothetical protein
MSPDHAMADKGNGARTVERILRWIVLLVLVLLIVRSLGSIASTIMSKAFIDAGLGDFLLAGYHLWQVPLWWMFAALFLAWEFYALKSFPSVGQAHGAGREQNALRLIAWPYTTFVHIRDTASSGTSSRSPVVLVFVGFFISVIMPKLVGLVVTDVGNAAYAIGSFYRIVELIWTATLFVMIWKIGRSPVFRKS